FNLHYYAILVLHICFMEERSFTATLDADLAYYSVVIDAITIRRCIHVLYKLIYPSWFFDVLEVRNCYRCCVDTGIMFFVPYVNGISYIDLLIRLCYLREGAILIQSSQLINLFILILFELIMAHQILVTGFSILLLYILLIKDSLIHAVALLDMEMKIKTMQTNLKINWAEDKETLYRPDLRFSAQEESWMTAKININLNFVGIAVWT
ncbi:hypothetical protein ACJX0J_039874, partial [Zea mays]